MSLFDKKFDLLLKNKLDSRPFESPEEPDVEEMGRLLDNNHSGIRIRKRNAIIFMGAFLCGIVMLILLVKGTLLEKTEPQPIATANILNRVDANPVISSPNEAVKELIAEIENHPAKTKKAVKKENTPVAITSAGAAVATAGEPVINDPALLPVQQADGEAAITDEQASLAMERHGISQSQTPEIAAINTQSKDLKNDDNTAPTPEQPEKSTETAGIKNTNDSAAALVQENKVSALRPDSVAPGDDEKRIRLKRFSNYSLMAGISMAMPYHNTSAVTKPDLKLTGGIFYDYDVKPFFNIGTGIQYTYREALNSSKSYSAIDYSFETKKYTNSITSKSLHYIQVPIDFKFYNRFVIGIYGAVLIGGNNQVQAYNMETSKMETKEKFGIARGFETFDWGARAAYEFPLTGKLNLKFAMMYGFVDISKNNYYANNAFTNNTWFQAQLIYALKTNMLK